MFRDFENALFTWYKSCAITVSVVTGKYLFLKRWTFSIISKARKIVRSGLVNKKNLVKRLGRD